jgi:branched-chain amino acid aminotransferase
MELAADMGIPCEEKLISIDELCDGIETGKVTEVFGAGTAAAISPIGIINVDDRDYTINNNKTGPWSKELYDELTGIQYGERPDKHDWVYKVT